MIRIGREGGREGWVGWGKSKSLFKGCYTKVQGECKVAKKVIAMHVRKCDDTANTNANAKCGCDAPSVTGGPLSCLSFRLENISLQIRGRRFIRMVLRKGGGWQGSGAKVPNLGCGKGAGPQLSEEDAQSLFQKGSSWEAWRCSRRDNTFVSYFLIIISDYHLTSLDTSALIVKF